MGSSLQRGPYVLLFMFFASFAVAPTASFAAAPTASRTVAPTASGAVAQDIQGAWRAETYVLAGGVSHPVDGMIFFTATDWTVLFFVLDQEGVARRGSGAKILHASAMASGPFVTMLLTNLASASIKDMNLVRSCVSIDLLKAISWQRTSSETSASAVDVGAKITQNAVNNLMHVYSL